MGMPVSVTIRNGSEKDIDDVYSFLSGVDAEFSPYKQTSAVSEMNTRGRAHIQSPRERALLQLAEKTRIETKGYFDIKTPRGGINPSGLVKGWAIHEAANILREKGITDFIVEAGGDVEVESTQEAWRIGIQNPFDAKTLAAVLDLTHGGIATSGTYERGAHIYNPHGKEDGMQLASVTVLAENVLDADRFATALFAMGEKAESFAKERGLEYLIISGEGAVTYSPQIGIIMKRV